ncbi:hypothetical protein HMPREF1392_00166 [Helicobacter pylori GAM101Biv]|nr:hypothetical protein HMPREF1392_00166 [Helicobacter pylori GAM101Biv]
MAHLDENIYTTTLLKALLQISQISQKSQQVFCLFTNYRIKVNRYLKIRSNKVLKHYNSFQAP